MNADWLIPVAAYFLGSIPFGLLLVKFAGRGDIRKSGSGNIGAANVSRSAGIFAGLLTLALDAGKGTLAVWLAAHIASGNIRWMMAAAVAAVLGHVFPVWLGLRGGKGVATGLGVLLLISPQAVGIAVALWILIVGFWRYSSLGSVVAAAAIPIFIYFLYAPGYAPPVAVTLGTVLISVIVLLKHRGNIGRLASGTEHKLSFRR